MKAFIKNDEILHISTNADTEIGPIPNGIGLERLRFDGNRVVDLATLSRIWVEYKNGNFFLHCIDIGNCQLVDMLYVHRHNLTNDNGTIRLKTDAELAEDGRLERNQMRKNRLRRRLREKAGDTDDKIADLGKLVLALLIFKKTGNQNLGDKLDQIADIALGAYTIDQMESGIRRFVTALKEEMPDYYNEIE